MNLTPTDHALAARIAQAHPLTAHGITRTGPAKLSGRHLSEAPNAADFLAGVAFAALGIAQARDLEKAVYVQLLQRTDWSFEHCDDHAVYMRGNEAMKELRAVQQAIDPTGATWNQWAPEGHRIGGAHE